MNSVSSCRHYSISFPVCDIPTRRCAARKALRLGLDFHWPEGQNAHVLVVREVAVRVQPITVPQLRARRDGLTDQTQHAGAVLRVDHDIEKLGDRQCGDPPSALSSDRGSESGGGQAKRADERDGSPTLSLFVLILNELPGCFAPRGADNLQKLRQAERRRRNSPPTHSSSRLAGSGMLGAPGVAEGAGCGENSRNWMVLDPSPYR